mmetsp:Transcript_18239/g.33529  ORF Transcript_18239/g.33529 Transcript_18239/m.33529 type:complete len:239 (+) Transcript_18239:186-902(+)
MDGLSAFMPLCRAISKKSLCAEVNGLLVVWRELSLTAPSAEVLIDPTADHVAQERCWTARCLMPIIHASVQQRQLLLPHLHGLCRTLLVWPGTVVQEDALKSPFTSPHQAAESICCILHRHHQLLQMLEHALYRSISNLCTRIAHLSGDVSVRLIDEHVLCAYGTLLPFGYTQRPERADKPMPVNTALDSVRPHAHVDLVLHPDALVKSPQALYQAFSLAGHGEDTTALKNGSLYSSL